MMAMIFAAGLGTRLGEYTLNRPKALVEIRGYKLLDLQIRKMYAFGITDIVVNVHHFADQVLDFLHHYPQKEIRFHISDESGELLDTGGGLKNAAPFFEANSYVLVHNVDVLSDVDFSNLEQRFLDSNQNCILLLKDRTSSRKLLFDSDMNLCGWKNIQSGEELSVKNASLGAYEFSYSGISIMRADFVANLPGIGAFPLIPSLLEAAAHKNISGIAIPHQWIDVGKTYELKEAEKHIDNYYQKWMK
ncbi:MAG: NTP transferase domain-containing protein [Bacteroidales bacterium]|nr:NTP transferase domain-containing protein [Bacteroidales bacterium]